MTKEEFLELQKHSQPIDIGKVCEYPVLKKVSYLMHAHDVSFDTIAVVAKELGVDNVKDENSMVSHDAYRRMKESLLENKQKKSLLSLKEKVFAYIEEQGEGFTFSTKDLLNFFTRAQSYRALSALVREGKIIKTIIRGIYYYPEKDRREGKSFFSGAKTAPGSSLANALARKYGWEIRMSSDTAEVWSAFTSFDTCDTYYYSTGPSKIYIEENDIKFVLIHVDNIEDVYMRRNQIALSLIPHNVVLSLILEFNIAYDDLVKVAKENDLYVFDDRWDIVDEKISKKLRELLEERYLFTQKN